MKYYINALIILTLFVVASRAFINENFLVYAAPVCLILILIAGFDLLKKDKDLQKILFLILPFGIWAGLTSLWSQYPVITFTRAGYFLLMASAAVTGVFLWRKSSGNFLGFLLPLNIAVIILSAVSLLSGYPDDAWTGGNGMGFMGFVTHQNTLGALILFTVPAVFYKGTSPIKRKPPHPNPLLKGEGVGKDKGIRGLLKTKILYIVLIGINLFILFLTHSRASLLAFFVFILLLGFLILKLKTVLITGAALVIFSGFLYLYPYTNIPVSTFLLKGENSPGDNRFYLWEASYKAALLGGLTGLGYGMSAPDIKIPAAGSHYENGRYIREKGNSMLALVEETGIVGLILFLFPVGYFLMENGRLARRRRVKKMENGRWKMEAGRLARRWRVKKMEAGKSGKKKLNPEIIMMAAILPALFLHAQFEAWLVGTAGFSLFIFISLLASAGNTTKPELAA